MPHLLNKLPVGFYVVLAMSILIASVSGVTLLFLHMAEAGAIYLGFNTFPVGVVCGLAGAVLMHATWKGVFRLMAPRSKPLKASEDATSS